jgi:hypothetical protein
LYFSGTEKCSDEGKCPFILGSFKTGFYCAFKLKYTNFFLSAENPTADEW